MKEVILSCGLTVTVDPDVFNDMEVVDLLADVQDNDVLAVSKLTTKVMGKDQKKAVYDAVRSADGKVDVAKFMGLFNELILALGESKKK